MSGAPGGAAGTGPPSEHPADHPGPLVFVADLSAPRLDDEDRHHLVRSLRLRPGDPLTVADGAGRWRPCHLGGDAAATPVAAGDVRATVRPGPALTIGFTPVKGDRPELVVQKLTELGVDRIVPLRAARSVVRWDGGERAARAVERLRRVARAAAMQCRRPDLPVVDDVTDVAAVASSPGAVMAQRGGGPPSLARPTVLVGPEGGWTPGELEGRPTVGIGADVLRAETAAIAAGVVLAALRAELVSARHLDR